MDDDFELSIPPEKDLSGTVFSDPNFFRFHPQLTASNVLLYFSTSPFWDNNNNLNSLMRTQLVSDPQAMKDFLQRSRGYYYEVANSPVIDPQNPQQPIWMVSKKFSFGREGDGEMKEIGLYYIVGQQIFQAPLWKDLAGSKLWQAASSIHQLLNEFWQAKEAITDIKRETPLLERREDPILQEPMKNALSTLEKQFEAVLRPRTN
jgi:hypothetical protein